MYVLGISAYYHDSAACLVKDGEIIAAAQEERFTRIKQDSSFPENAVKFVLEFAKINVNDVDLIVFYDKPLLKFDRILETYISFAPKGFKSCIKSLPVWLKEKLYLGDTIKKEIDYSGKIIYAMHHDSHAASTFYPSPYEHAAILTIDGVGEWATTTLGIGKDRDIKILYEMHFPHSLGLLYSAFTYYLGFKINSGEYKVMGLYPYGEPKYVNTILDNIINLHEDGSFHLNMEYFDFCTGLKMTSDKFHSLFGGDPRLPETKMTQKEMDIAASLQEVVNMVFRKMARFVKKETGEKNLCLSGGVALNCVANGCILREKIFENIWIQPAAGDAGGALGAALIGYYNYLDKPRKVNKFDSQKGSYLGKEYSNEEIQKFLEKYGIKYKKVDNEEELIDKVSDLIIDQKVIGWHQGRFEFGPRALGNRSIIGDPRSTKMQSILNLKIKYRESFRPFAPSVMLDKVTDFFEDEVESSYMLLTSYIKEHRRIPMTDEEKKLWGIDKLKVKRSDIPAVTHVDYSARLQTVKEADNPRYYKLINSFYKKTNVPVIINTSFNVRGEPIVNSPMDSFKCFMRTEMDFLVLENFIIDKSEQDDSLKQKINWDDKYELD